MCIQELIGAAKMWRQFWVQLPYAMFMAASFIIFIPRFGATGFASPTLVSSLILAGLTLLSARLSDHDHSRRAPSDLTPTEPVPNANY